VRVAVVKDEAGKDKLGFEYVDGPVTPRPEKLPQPRPKAKRRSSPRRKPQGPPKSNGSGNGGDGGPPRGGSVPKVPLVKV
jgi:ATP-dependent Clp protease ATP-binding subunit ClpA